MISEVSMYTNTIKEIAIIYNTALWKNELTCQLRILETSFLLTFYKSNATVDRKQINQKSAKYQSKAEGN